MSKKWKISEIGLCSSLLDDKLEKKDGKIKICVEFNRLGKISDDIFK